MKESYKDYAIFMKALSDETRIKIYKMLSKGEFCACDILGGLSITQSTLSYHMKILCMAGLVSGRKDGVWMRYSIHQENLEKIKIFFHHMSIEVSELV